MNSLKFSDESCFEIMKQYESAKIKAYVCLVRCEKDICDEDIKNLNSQETLKVFFFCFIFSIISSIKKLPSEFYIVEL